MGITDVAFGRTELSLRLSWIEFRALFHRRGPEGPGVQGMPEKSFSMMRRGANFQEKLETSEFVCMKNDFSGIPWADFQNSKWSTS